MRTVAHSMHTAIESDKNVLFSLHGNVYAGIFVTRAEQKQCFTLITAMLNLSVYIHSERLTWNSAKSCSFKMP